MSAQEKLQERVANILGGQLLEILTLRARIEELEGTVSSMLAKQTAEGKQNGQKPAKTENGDGRPSAAV